MSILRFLRKLKSKLRRSYYKLQYGIDTKEGSIIGAKCKILGDAIAIGRNSTIGTNSWVQTIQKYHIFDYSGKITIGNGVNIGGHACITAANEIVIGDNCLFSEYVYITDHFHGYDPEGGRLIEQKLSSKGSTIIGENSFLGFRVTVLSGVNLGRNCVVGSHSVVTSSFPDYSMIAGVPARLIKKYDKNIKQWIEVE